MSPPESMSFSYLVIAAVAVSFALLQINQRLASPLLSIADRWLRWLVFTFGGAQICIDFDLIDRPFWMLALTFFLLWFLIENLFNWLRISALSVSPLPLFPRYELNQDGDEWPIQPRLLQIRDWLRSHGFKQVQALKAEIGGGIYLRVSVYQDEAATLRIQVTFIPQANGAVTVCYALTSMTADGQRYITDNLFVPFAGFYAENWFVERTPWRRSLPKLLERHRARLRAARIEAAPLVIDALTDQNDAQQELDRINTELGFLHLPGQREDHGKITHEGRFRVWKEIWMLNYLGRALRYE